MNKTIAIAGLGWLGLSFAQRLMMLGYSVKGSVTTAKKAASLKTKGFDAYAVEISEQGVSGQTQDFLKDADVLAIMIPPGIRRNTGADFVQKMSHFLKEIENSEVKKIILVSSTSVYGDAQGEVNESDLPIPDAESGRQLFQVEQLFYNSTSFKTAIVRFGGLIGASRQPVKYLAGRKDLNGGNAPVNLIHREDCIGILLEIIRKDAFSQFYNAVAPQHPIKKEYYTQKAKEMDLVIPTFAEEDQEEKYKTVHSKNLDGILGYRFLKEI